MSKVLDRIEALYLESKQSKVHKPGPVLLYQQVYHLLKEAIINNRLPSDSILPPTRLLAGKLGLSRSTIIRAYELLRLEGYIGSVAGSGHTVKPVSSPVEFNAMLKANRTYPEISDMGKSFLQNVSLINSTDDKSIAFRPGLPPLDIFPVTQWKNLSNLYWRYIKTSALSYSPSAGLDQLKKNISNYLNLSRNIKCDPRQIIIVSGSLQSLYLVGNAVLNPGDPVVMENPTFPNVYSIFKGLRARIMPVSVDATGMRVQDLEGGTYAEAKLLHCTPSSHYPLGVQMSITRRKELIDWAQRTNTFIIENDYEHEIHNYDHPQPAVFSLDTHQRTIYLSTFNRLMHPSIRIGYMVLPFYLVDTVEALLKHSHRFVPPATQVVLNQFIEKKYLYKHIKKVADVAEERKSIFTEAFEAGFGDSIKLDTGDTRSLHMLARLPAGIPDSDVVDLFTRRNIVVHAFSKCFVGEHKEQGIIMGYSSVRPPVIRQKIQQMAKLFHEKYG